MERDVFRDKGVKRIIRLAVPGMASRDRFFVYKLTHRLFHLPLCRTQSFINSVCRAYDNKISLLIKIVDKALLLGIDERDIFVGKAYVRAVDGKIPLAYTVKHRLFGNKP